MDYRVLLLRPDGAVKEFFDLAAADDGEALGIGRALALGQPFEVWEDGRRVRAEERESRQH